MTAVHATPPDPSADKPVYPFAEWLDGRTWRLTRGRDFWGPPWLFARRLQASANARRLCLALFDFDPDGQTIELRAVPRG